MRHMLATVGYTPEKVTEALLYEAPLGALTAFFGSARNQATQRALAGIRRAARPLGITLKQVEIGSAYDFVAAVAAYRAHVRSRADEYVFNVSGGTGVMQTAAAFVCFTEGIPFGYYNREDRKYVKNDAIRLEPWGGLRDQQRRVLGFVAKAAARGVRPVDIARGLRLSPTNVDHHLRRLRERRLVEDVAPAPGKRRGGVAATASARLLL